MNNHELLIGVVTFLIIQCQCIRRDINVAWEICDRKNVSDNNFPLIMLNSPMKHHTLQLSVNLKTQKFSMEVNCLKKKKFIEIPIHHLRNNLSIISNHLDNSIDLFTGNFSTKFLLDSDCLITGREELVEKIYNVPNDIQFCFQVIHLTPHITGFQIHQPTDSQQCKLCKHGKECQNELCQNGAKCAVSKTSSQSNNHCICPDGYYGQHCQFSKSSLCSGNNSKCTVNSDTVLRRVKRATDPCQPNPCQNGGTCLLKGAASYQCECPNGLEGSICENINCGKNPCKFASSCNSTTNSCVCIDGFEGNICEKKVSKCQPNPCKNNARCYDMLNDYLCMDSLTKNKYGGKDGSVELTGCKENPCKAPTSECYPIYDETKKEHGHECKCIQGLFGPTCTVNTTYSVAKSSHYHYPLNSEVNEVAYSMAIKTEDKEGVLFILEFNLDPKYMSVEVFNHGIRVTTADQSKMIIPENTVTKKSDNYVPYQFLVQLKQVQSVNVLCLYVRPQNINQGHFCVKYGASTMKVTFYIATSAMIRPQFNIPKYKVGRAITMCLVDFYVNKVYKAMATLNFACLKKKPCSDNGDICRIKDGRGKQCTEYWTEFQCVCRRPFKGDTCNEEHETKGSKGLRNYVQIDYTGNTFLKSLNKKIDISLILSTSSSKGILMYMGSFDQNTYVAAEVIDGYLSINSKSSTKSEKLPFKSSYSWKIDDKKSRMIQILFEGNTVKVTLKENSADNKITILTVSETKSFTNDFQPNLISALTELNIIFLGVGAAPPIASANKLSIISEVRENNVPLTNSIFASTDSLIGKIQNLEINSFGHTWNTPSETSLGVVKSTLSNVDPENCNNTICNNNGECIKDSVFKTDTCKCKPEYHGDKCQYQNKCTTNNKCDSATTCAPVENNTLCLQPLSIIKEKSVIVLNSKDKTATYKQLALKLTTFFSGSTIFSIVSSASTSSLSVDKTGKLVGSVKGSDGTDVVTQVVTKQMVNDGKSHDIVFTFSPGLEIVVDKVINRANDYRAKTINPLIAITTVTFGDKTNDFLGCMKDVKLENEFISTKGTILSNSKLLELNQGESKFVQNCTALEICANKPCSAAGRCHVNCTCKPGYSGKDCAIADCTVLKACENGVSGCKQICPSNTNPSCSGDDKKYGCDCKPGWVGVRCTITNACGSADNPVCKNNGKCSQTINESAGSSTYKCTCTSAYTGTNCETSVAKISSLGVAGIVVAIFLLIVIIAMIVWAYKRYQHKKTEEYNPYEEEANNFRSDDILKKPNMERII